MSKDTYSRFEIDKHWMRRSFAKAAGTYDEVAVLQQEVARRLTEHLEYIQISPATILDLGSGTGYCSELLAQRFPDQEILALDIVHSMLQLGRSKSSRKNLDYVCGDADNLPIKENSVDLLVSSLALQWCFDLEKTFSELFRVIKPGGLLLFASMGPDTLKELRASWAQVDEYEHVSAFYDMHDVGDALMRKGFAEAVMEMQHITLTYQTVDHLMRDLQMLGSRNALRGRARGLTGKGKIEQMKQAYERFRSDDSYPATYEIVFGHCWKPVALGNVQHRGKEFPIPVKPVR